LSVPARAPSPAGRRVLIFSAWGLWIAVLVSAAILLWVGAAAAGSASGMKIFIWGLALALLVPYLPLRLLAAWRCRRAAARLPESWRSGEVELPGWPGVRDAKGVLRMRCGSWGLRLWALSLGLALSGYLVGQLGQNEDTYSAFDLVLSLAPAVCSVLLSLLWGPSGWELTVDTARSKAVLVLWRALRRSYYSSAGVFTVQGVEVAGGRRGWGRGVVVRRAKGADWKLGIPSTWPQELVEALAARLSGLAGVEFGAKSEDNIGDGSGKEVGAAVEEVTE
jgi:hypothetical protein